MCDKAIFRDYLIAGYPLLWVESYEEFKVITRLLQEMKTYKSAEYNIYSWDLLKGIKRYSINEKGIPESALIETQEQIDELLVLNWAESAMGEHSILVLKDYHKFTKATTVCRGLRNLVPVFRSCYKTIIILSPTVEIPVELEKEVTVIQFPLPDIDELRIVLKSVCSDNDITYPTEDIQLLRSALGMTVFEAENAFAYSLTSTKGKLDQSIIQQKKADVVKKTGMLEVIDADVNLDDVGGLDNLKVWLKNRESCFTDEARKFGIRPPKGLLLIGTPGTGKSLTAKAVAASWKRPLLRLEMGKIFGSLVGESEANLRKCLHIAEAVAPCVVWLDELEKAFAGVKGESNDGHGTTKRVFGNFLTWMSEKTSDVFIIATANEVESLPAALLRGGRFDAIFWVDLPDEAQRIEILKIHLKKVGRSMNDESLTWLAKASEGYSGAEIEVWVQESLVKSLASKSDLTPKIMHEVLPEITPISKLMSQEIDSARKWAEKQGVKVASLRKVKVETPQKRKVGIMPSVGS